MTLFYRCQRCAAQSLGAVIACTVSQTDKLLHIYTLHALRRIRSETMTASFLSLLADSCSVACRVIDVDRLSCTCMGYALRWIRFEGFLCNYPGIHVLQRRIKDVTDANWLRFLLLLT